LPNFFNAMLRSLKALDAFRSPPQREAAAKAKAALRSLEGFTSALNKIKVSALGGESEAQNASEPARMVKKRVR
jgi:hypothetical protein